MLTYSGSDSSQQTTLGFPILRVKPEVFSRTRSPKYEHKIALSVLVKRKKRFLHLWGTKFMYEEETIKIVYADGTAKDIKKITRSGDGLLQLFAVMTFITLLITSASYFLSHTTNEATNSRGGNIQGIGTQTVVRENPRENY
jgi:hypothetical protein